MRITVLNSSVICALVPQVCHCQGDPEYVVRARQQIRSDQPKADEDRLAELLLISFMKKVEVQECQLDCVQPGSKVGGRGWYVWEFTQFAT